MDDQPTPISPEADAVPADETAIVTEVRSLRRELERLNGHRFVRIHQSPVRLVLFQFFRGLAFGLGTVVGATILVSVLVYLLSQVEIVPILGDWATAIIQQIETGRAAPGE